MATTALTTAATGDHHPETTLATDSITTPEAVSTDKNDGGSDGTKSNANVPVTVTNTEDNRNNNEDGDLVTDTQRKIRRAERFGMPVQLSEEEKRNSRAER